MAAGGQQRQQQQQQLQLHTQIIAGEFPPAAEALANG